ncbi:DNA-binding transcriptional regulator, MarR family [Pseudonocardia thermophila]|jgi:Transcriptional regulators|uniref:DNA-binding transcriptional regulator, MarR family n=2 Tax=Pseudonocardia thermophila TaxID=1848 RepID=A0A1M6XZB4_PSETH|nr:MarR family transcriptional regulator [Pseudonocardia thermophila]SHL11173.1 DNA-binding transcriptional regulator, MarR family [Pseudonocardia thermophila]
MQEIDAEAAARLRRVVVRLARTLNGSAVAEGLSPTQASILATIGFRGPMQPAAIAEAEGVNPTMLSRMLTKLDERGLIRRLPHPGDQRAVLVEATPAGQQTCDRIRAARTEMVKELLRELPPHYVRAVLDALPALEAMAGLEQRS